MRTRVVVLGAGFGGLELTTILSDTFGDAIDIVLIDQSEAFVFGFSKLDVMFGRRMPADVRHPLPRHCQTGRAISAVDGTIHRPGRPARGD
jgi:sulfide:quinone oxidoreductase